jgi:hypothetical protein
VLILAALLLVFMMALLAFAIDIGYIVLVRTQLQAAADSAAMAAGETMALPRDEMEAVAKQFAGYNDGGGRKVELLSKDIEYGMWDASVRVFTPSATPGNAVRVTTRTDSETGGEAALFFGRIFNRDSFAQRASAVSMCNPRDIVFVVDLSGSMNDDTDPKNTASLNSEYAPLGYPNIGSELLQKVYNDFNFGTYPGVSEWVGKPLGVSSSDSLNKLMDTSGPLSKSTIPTKYRIKSSDSTTVRKQKAYSWVMDVQIPQVMPAAKPVPNSSSNYAYWAKYLDSYSSQVGYLSYTRFMMYYGRDLRPDGSTYVPLSRLSPDCPWHTESTPGGTFSFPPSEQPTHASRRAIIAAMAVVKERNEGISDLSQRDWVSIVTFDKITGGGPVVLQPLTGDYDAAMRAATTMQACGDDTYSTATETGLIAGANLVKRQSEGGSGREATNKVVVLLTDGQPNLYSSPNNTISSYVSANPSPNFYSGTSKNAYQAALMQTSMMKGNRWQMFPVGIGLGTDYDFMDRLSRLGGTANDSGKSPRGSANPAEYEQRLTEIFDEIIRSPRVRLVQ